METRAPAWRRVTGVVLIVAGGILAMIGWGWFEDVPEGASTVESMRGIVTLLAAAGVALLGVWTMSVRRGGDAPGGDG